ncbi:hypothetical protein Tco_0388500, partial [Tanacetum coccineum]
MRPSGLISKEAWRISENQELTPTLSRNASFDFTEENSKRTHNSP